MQAAFDRASNFGEKSDIWRYEILFRLGGVYVDTDFECVRPFDSLLEVLIWPIPCAVSVA
jgi:mannosyltransferase OCH1-like enzyme